MESGDTRELWEIRETRTSGSQGLPGIPGSQWSHGVMRGKGDYRHQRVRGVLVSQWRLERPRSYGRQGTPGKLGSRETIDTRESRDISDQERPGIQVSPGRRRT